MKSCPQFSQGKNFSARSRNFLFLIVLLGCPFKTVCSDGSLLITALQAHRWDMIFSASDLEAIVDKEGSEDLEEP